MRRTVTMLLWLLIAGVAFAAQDRGGGGRGGFGGGHALSSGGHSPGAIGGGSWGGDAAITVGVGMVVVSAGATSDVVMGGDLAAGDLAAGDSVLGIGHGITDRTITTIPTPLVTRVPTTVTHLIRHIPFSTRYLQSG